MTSSVEINELVQCKYSKIVIDRDGLTVTKKVIDWLEFGVFEREIYWLQRLADIPFIPNLLDFDHNSKTLITEYAGERLTADNLPVDWDLQARTIIRTLRKYDCAHNDIKPSELLVNDGKLSLCDFAWATPYGAPIPTHWPPALGEEFAFEKHSSLNDCFSLMRSVCWVMETDRKPPANQLSCNQHTESELEFGEKNFQFCLTPNMYAGSLDYIENVDTSVVKGYQCYEINAKTIRPIGGNFTSPKSKALLSFFTAENFSNKTVNDLGCANGFFSFSSMFAGAEKTFAIDMDEDHLAQIDHVIKRFDFSKVETLCSNVKDYNRPADITICLALIHWIYSCTAFYGNFTSCLYHLNNITRKTLIIEWIDPQDTAILNFGHLDYNQHSEREAYCFDNFMAAVRQFFPNCLEEHEVSETRTVFCFSK